MFLEGLKAKSILKKIDQEAQARVYHPGISKVGTVAILQERDFPFNPGSIVRLAAALGVEARNIHLLEYSSSIAKEDREVHSLFSSKQVGWKGVFKTKVLKDFEQSPFDILISFYDSDIIALQAMTAFSKASIKVGISRSLEHLNDLTICISQGQETIFIEELHKYLKILKVLQ